MMNAPRLAALAAVLLVGSVTPAHAIPVTYSTTGVFLSSGTNTLSQGGAQIRFNALGATTVNPPPTTNAIFGSFETLALPASSATLSDSFTLTITQTAPGPGAVTFTSTVSGTIFVGNSQAFVQFNTPLMRSITSGGFVTTYRIVEGDDQFPGRLELLGNTGVAGTSTLNGEVGIAAIPEPGTMALACIALPLLGLGYARRRRQMV